MSHVWPSETVFERVDLTLDGQSCNTCGSELAMWGHRKRRGCTPPRPQLLVVRLGHFPEPDCPGHHRSVSARAGMALAPPRLMVAWGVVAWVGPPRFSRGWGGRGKRFRREGFPAFS